MYFEINSEFDVHLFEFFGAPNPVVVSRWIKILVHDVNEAPINISLSNQRVMENSKPYTLVGLLNSDDQDAADRHFYSLVPGSGGDDNNKFLINGDELRVAAALGSQPFYNVRIRSTDRAGAYTEKAFQLNTTSIADARVYAFSTDIIENFDNGTLVENVNVLDNWVLFTIVAGNVGNAFAIDQATQELRVNDNTILDYETHPEFHLSIHAYDENGIMSILNVNVNLINVNERPKEILLDNTSIRQSSETWVRVGSLVTIDEDESDSFTYSFMNGDGDDDNGLFRLVGNEVFLNEAPSFARKPFYQIRVASNDRRLLSVENKFRIDVIKDPEPPVLDDTEFTVSENTAIGTLLLTIQASDSDNDISSFSIIGGNTGEMFRLENGTGKLVLSKPLDYEQQTVYVLTVAVEDVTNLESQGKITIYVRDENEPPIRVLLSNSSVVDGAMAPVIIGELDTNDPDQGELHTYTLPQGMDDNDAFEIVGSSLYLTEAPAYARKQLYRVVVRSTDDKGLFVEDNFVIMVIAPDYPVVVDRVVRVWEHLPVGSLVTKVGVQSSGPVSFQFDTGTNDANTFVLDGRLGEIRLNEQLNYEQTPGYNLRIIVTNEAGLSTSTNVTILVDDENDIPTSILLENMTIPENGAAPVLVGKLTTLDEDFDELHEYELAAGAGDDDNILFRIEEQQLFFLISADLRKP
ncbi:MAG: hypothetical protein HC859_16735 [Bacteroidia bacterium]|nr:hypothetical protein [Bacteroidia bacterium]